MYLNLLSPLFSLCIILDVHVLTLSGSDECRRFLLPPRRDIVVDLGTKWEKCNLKDKKTKTKTIATNKTYKSILATWDFLNILDNSTQFVCSLWFFSIRREQARSSQHSFRSDNFYSASNSLWNLYSLEALQLLQDTTFFKEFTPFVNISNKKNGCMSTYLAHCCTFCRSVIEKWSAFCAGRHWTYKRGINYISDSSIQFSSFR